MPIHPTAIIHAEAVVSDSADVGPYVVIDGPVRIGERVKIYPHAYLSGWTEIGEDCEIHPHAVIGHLPQDFHFGGGRTYCKIGPRTILREGVSVHRGTQPESTTEIGPDCFLLANSHVGHNCRLGAHVKLINGALLSGHVDIDDYAIVSGNSGIHQFVRIGQYAMIGGLARVPQDVLPYMSLVKDSECNGYNAVGLKRSGKFTTEEINEVRTAYRMLFRSAQPFAKAVDAFRRVAKNKTGLEILRFIDAESKRGIATAGRPARAARRLSSHFDSPKEEAE